MHAFRSVAFLLLAGVVTKAASTAPSGSDFVAAVYEHAFVRVENRTAVLPRQEAVAIVMSNMDVYETQMQKAKEQVFIPELSSQLGAGQLRVRNLSRRWRMNEY